MICLEIPKNGKILLKAHFKVARIQAIYRTKQKRNSGNTYVYIQKRDDEIIYVWNDCGLESKSVNLRLDTKTIKEFGCTGPGRVVVWGFYIKIDRRLLSDLKPEDMVMNKEQVESNKTFQTLISQLGYLSNKYDISIS